uniref:DNA polymerase I n=1 Tax=Dictyoglomus turgidum TaxID=513050 RepID=A0A7C3WNE9_9BACT
MYDLNCQKCELYKNRTQVVPSVIVEGSEIFFIGEAPGVEEDKKGIPFVGDAGNLLNACLREVGIDREKVSIGNICACRPPDNRVPLPKEVESCFEFLEQDILSLKPKVIVTLGNTPLKKFLKGVGGITRVHGKIFDCEEYNCKIIPLFHPAYILRNPQERTKFTNDLRTVKDFLQGKIKIENESPVDYKVVTNLAQFDWLVSQLHENDLWAFDIETTGLDFMKDEIFILTFSWMENTGVLIDLRILTQKIDKDYIFDKLKEVFENNSKKIAHNGSFDIEFLLSRGIIVNNYYCDTILMDHLLDENSPHGLEVLSEKYTDLGRYDIPLNQYKLQNKISNYSDIPGEILYLYALKDVDCTLRSYNKMLPEIYEQKLDFVLFEIMMPMQRILIQTEFCGVSIDIDYLNKTIEKYEKKMEEYLQKIYEVPQVKQFELEKTNEKIKELYEKWESSAFLQKRFPNFEDYLEFKKEETRFVFNINSPKQLKELLIEKMKLPIIKTTVKNNPSLDDEVLLEYSKANKFCEYLAKYRTLSHLKSTFLDGIKKRLVGDKVHTDYLLFGTVTGRPSSRNPNLNNIPRTGTAEDIKDIFCADRYEDGTSDWLVEVDQGQAEFRIWINYSKDPQALRDLQNGIDIHKLMAAAAYKKVPIPNRDISYEEFLEITKDVTKAERQDTKLIIFGIMYGRGAKSVSEQLGVSPSLAQRIIDTFFNRYKVAKKWLAVTTALAKRDGYVVNLFGRRRRLLNINSSNQGLRAEAERQSINSPIQSAASDLTFLSCVKVFREIRKRSLRSRLVLTVYDSLVFNVPDDELEFVSKLLYNKMLNPEVSDLIVPLSPEIKIGKSWGSLVEVDLTKDWSIIREMLREKFEFHK